MFGNKVGHLGRVGSLTLAQRVSAMFSRGEPGAWYDPSDMSTLFQDSAGTTPVTAVEQPVGRMLDKSGRGNHATQATTTKRPVLSRRVNLLTKTEDFTAAYWTKDGVAVSNSHPSPGGGMSAMSMLQSNSTGFHAIRAVYGFAMNVYSYSVRVKRNGARYFQIANQTSGVVVNFDLDSVTYQVVGGAVVGASITPIGDGWHLLNVRFATAYEGIYNVIVTSLSAPRLENFTGDGVSGFLIDAPFVCLPVDAHLPYQWVNTATDYDADPNKFPAYLRFDGVDDALQTGNIDFTSTDKMTVWAGVTKLSDAARATVTELGNGSVDTSSILYINAPGFPPSTDKFAFAAVAPVLGASVATATGSDLNAPINTVVCGFYTPGETSKLRINSVQRAAAGAVNPAGNFASRPLYIGARAGTSLFFNGRIYSLIVRGAQTPLSRIEATELYIKQKMRMP